MSRLRKINSELYIEDEDIKFVHIKSSGPGGQNVNKVSTGVQLIFDINNSSFLSEKIKNRIHKIASNRINKDGLLIIKANRFRSQSKNKQDALLRLREIILSASAVKKRRVKTNPTISSNENRIKRKKINSIKKSLRKNIDPDL